MISRSVQGWEQVKGLAAEAVEEDTRSAWSHDVLAVVLHTIMPQACWALQKGLVRSCTDQPALLVCA